MEYGEQYPFVVYTLYTPTYPAALFGQAPFFHANDQRMLSGSALVVSAGICRNAGNDVLAIPCGGNTSSEAKQFVEEIVSRIVGVDDFVQVIIDKNYAEGLKEQLTLQEIAFFEKSDTTTIFTRGSSMSNIHWLRGQRVDAEAYVIASASGSSRLEQEIEHEARFGTDPSGAKWVVDRYWHSFVNDAERAVTMLNDYRIFVYPGGFSPHDIVLQMQNVDVEFLRRLLASVAVKLGMPLFESPVYTSQQETAVWHSDGSWQRIPAVFSRKA